MSLSSEMFYEVVQSLNNHEEALRIKKVLFCLCNQYWENDINLLKLVSLEKLINDLLKITDNYEKLNLYVSSLVNKLNRPKVYEPVGQFILQELSKLYHQPTRAKVHEVEEEDTQLLIPEKETRDNEEVYVLDQIVENLEKNQEETRIKKLIFLIC